jgi:hypothetical protein
VLRNELGADRETYLHLIAGANHEHYDYDSGSIVVWGQGRAVAEDWGYVGRHPARWHSMLTSGAVGNGVMHIDTFSPSPALDYVSGKKGAWTRQIVFAKDANPAGPNFFVIRDTHDADVPAEWRLWLVAEALVVTPWGAQMTGEEDVDCDIFIYNPQKLSLSTETGEHTSGSGYRDGKTGRRTTRQTALKGRLAGRGAVVTVIYPRLKNTPGPSVGWLAEGCGTRVKSSGGEDFVFLASDHFEWTRGEVAFSGTAGALQLRKKPTLSLGAPGKLRMGKVAVEK